MLEHVATQEPDAGKPSKKPLQSTYTHLYRKNTMWKQVLFVVRSWINYMLEHVATQEPDAGKPSKKPLQSTYTHLYWKEYNVKTGIFRIESLDITC